MTVLLAGCGGHAKPSIELYERGDYAGAARAADEGLKDHPSDDGLWQMRIRAALAQGDGDALARSYAAYAKTRDDLDKDLLRDLARAALGQALASPSAKLKIAAIETVEEVELHDLADQVAEQMESDNDRVSATAASAILNGFPQAKEVIANALRSEDPVARKIAVDALGKKVYKRAGAAIFVDLHKATADRDAGVRRAAIRWLGQFKDPEVRPVAIAHLEKDPDDGVRAASASALARLGGTPADLIGFATKAIGDKRIAVRLAAIELYAAAKDTAGLRKLLDDADPLVALNAAIELHDGGAAALDRAIQSDAWTTRAAAVNLAAHADRASVARIAKQLAADPEPAVRVAAARALAHAGERDGAIGILAALAGTNVNAAADLAELGDPRGDEALSAATRRGTSADDRSAAAFAHRTAHRVTPGLVAALADPSGVVRVEAAAALAVLSR